MADAAENVPEVEAMSGEKAVAVIDAQPWWQKMLIQMPALAVLFYFGQLFATHYQSMEKAREENRKYTTDKTYQAELMRAEAIKALTMAINSQADATAAMQGSTVALTAAVANAKGADAAQHEEFMRALRSEEESRNRRAEIYRDVGDMLKVLTDILKGMK